MEKCQNKLITSHDQYRRDQRAILAAADRMADAIEAAAISGLCEKGWKELHRRVEAYRKEANHDRT